MRTTARCPSARRQGLTLTSLALVSSFVFILFAAVAIDLSLITTRREELQRGCDAAALAACAELHDPTPLYTVVKANSGDRSADNGQESDAHSRRLAQAAQATAITVASKNPIGTTPLELQANPTNDPQGQIVLGWVHASDDPTEELMAWGGGSLLNSVTVQLRREHHHVVTLHAARLLGLSKVNLATTSRATLDRHVYGFEPAGGVPVPAVPILICSESWHEQVHGHQAQDNLAKGGESQSFRPGSDRIAEVTICLGRSDDQQKDLPSARLMLLGDEVSEVAVKQQIKRGLNPRDLAESRGRLELFQQHTLCSSWPGLGDYLHEIRGQPRIWALGSCGKQANERLSPGEITNFVAAEVISSSVGPDGQICVILQPCLMTTSTALLGKEAPQSELIGKVMLTR